MTAQKPIRFLDSRQQPGGCTWQIVGLPYDATSSYRKGARFGPDEIRLASDSIESYSPYCNRDLEEPGFFDAGDLNVAQKDPSEAVEIIADYYQRAYQQGLKLMGLGGEHTVTIGALQGIIQERIARGEILPWVLQLDAHLDLREEYTGGHNSHACVARRIAEMVGADHLVQWGMRSGERAEFEWARNHGTYAETDLASLRKVCERNAATSLYVTLDLDVFDPAELPGVGNPEPGGLKFSEFLELVDLFKTLNVIGADVVELSPVWDPGGRSAVIAAEIVRELMLAVAHRGDENALP